MKRFVFPYYISFGKLDSVDGNIRCTLSDEEAARLEQSAHEGGRMRLNEDEDIIDIFDHVYESILSKEKKMLLQDTSPVADALSWTSDYDPSAPITEKQIDDYLDDLSIGINYPKKFQLLKRTEPKEIKQSECEEVIIDSQCAKNYILAKENCNKIVYIDNGETLYYVPKSYSGKFVVTERVKTLEANAFKNCKRITEIYIENGIETIPEWAFDGCRSLVRVSLPSSVKKIEFNAFTQCGELKTIELSEGLEYLDNTAFRACFKLEVLHIPASVKEISMHINSYHNGLKQIFFEGMETMIDDSHGGDWQRMTIHAKPGSVAEGFAKSKSLKLCKY